MPSKKHIGKESNEKERNRKRKGKRFMNAPEAGMTAALKLSKTLDSLRETSRSTLLIDLGTEQNGSFFFSVVFGQLTVVYIRFLTDFGS